MNEKKTLIKFFIVLLATFVGIYLCIFGFDKNGSGSFREVKQGLDLAGGVSITYQVVGEETPSPEDMADTIYKMQKRVETYSTEALVYQEGQDRINIEIPGVTNANDVLEELGKPGSLVFTDEDGNIVLNGTDIAEAKAATQPDQMGNTEFVVALTMTEEGTQKFAEATKKAKPNNEIIYIVYDDEIVSAPMVTEEITNGQCVIQGMDSFEEAERLSTTIRIGGLKLTLEELWSKTVGAQLGSHAITTSLQAGAVGMILIMAFMVIAYRLPGLASGISLVLYVVLTILLLNGFEITLTLPGIAGIILSIGMAVDANVIIFARIREELAEGMSVSTAIKNGFKRAMSAILDGNITTLIAAAVLGLMGSGSVKGFAQTLALGIVLSMFTSLLITRILITGFYALGLQDIRFYGMPKKLKEFKFLSAKGVCFGVSLLLIGTGVIFMGINLVKNGEIFNYSLDFKGGTATTITFNEDKSIDEIDSDIVPVIEEIIGGSGVVPQKVEGTTEVIIKTKTLSVVERERLNQALEERFNVKEDQISTETISSTISDEMKKESLLAVSIATLCMMIYVWFRFSDIRFGASSVMALIHDVFIVAGFYAIMRISVGSTFIACILTIVGYSINATIVIFDRIRENLHGGEDSQELYEMINSSINQTLSRSIFTSLTTLVSIAALYVMGVTAIKEFALPLMVGIISGAYSSVCLAPALWYILKLKIADREREEDE